MSESPNNCEIMIQATGSNQPDAVVAYYDQTWLDYRLFWLNRRTLSVHFGYTDTTTRGHADALLNMNRELADRARHVARNLAMARRRSRRRESSAVFYFETRNARGYCKRGGDESFRRKSFAAANVAASARKFWTGQDAIGKHM